MEEEYNELMKEHSERKEEDGEKIEEGNNESM